MCMQGMETLFYGFVGIGLLFLPLTILAGLGWGVAVLGEGAWKAFKPLPSELRTKLVEHGLNKHLADLQGKLEKQPEDCNARFQRSMAFYLKDDVVNATSDLQLCVAHGMCSVEVCFFLGLFYAKVGEYEEAEKTFKKGVRLAKHPEESRFTPCGGNGKPIPFNTFELFNARASNLYRMAYEKNTSVDRKEHLVVKAQKASNKSADLVLKQSSQDATRVFQLKGLITFYRALQPSLYQDYYTASWMRARLILLGTQDPASPLNMIKDSDFLWQFIFKTLKRAMKDRRRDPQFCGVVISNQSKALLQEAGQIFSEHPGDYGSTLTDGVNVVTNYINYFCLDSDSFANTQPSKLDKSSHPFWRSRLVSTWLVHVPRLSLPAFEWRMNFLMPVDNNDTLAKQEVSFTWAADSDYAVLADGQAIPVEWDLEGGRFYASFDYPNLAAPAHISLNLTRIGDKWFGEDYFGTITSTTFNGELPVSFTFPNLKSILYDVHKFLLAVPHPFAVDNDQQTTNKLSLAKAAHTFESIRLNRPHWCQHCGHSIKSWGFANHLQCTTCDMIVHSKCKGSVVATCYSKA